MEQNSNENPASPPSERPARQRRCLACGDAFASASPFLRICAACKDSDEWRSGNVDMAVHPRSPANDN